MKINAAMEKMQVTKESPGKRQYSSSFRSSKVQVSKNGVVATKKSCIELMKTSKDLLSLYSPF